MDKKQSPSFIGLAKVMFTSSVCHIQEGPKGWESEMFSTERITRKKGSGDWPIRALSMAAKKFGTNRLIAENRDVSRPGYFELNLNKVFPLFELLKKNELEDFSSHFNPGIKFLTHHLCHAYACLGMSPFKKSLIIVMDGAGSMSQDFPGEKLAGEENFFTTEDNLHEEFSAYLQEDGKLTCVSKEWQKFRPGNQNPDQTFSEGAGMLYEKAAEYIFNSKRAAGKVMGLAAFGTAQEINDPISYLDSLDWKMAFKGSDKIEWENSPHSQHYQNIAASVQAFFERVYLGRLSKLSENYPEVENVILAGGCALNCISNMKLVDKKIFKKVYAPPFPSDEGIGFGLASYLSYDNGRVWQRLAIETQHGYLGPKSSIPTDDKVQKVFDGFEMEKPENICEFIAELIKDNKVIAWFQGRSESGPRALGNRSIIARVDYPGLKDYLNQNIKFRESFRPYACSCLREKSSEYFEVPEDFENPYMSFAVPVKDNFRKQFKEVCHIDGTSRMQSVTTGQNPLFYQLIEAVGRKTDIYAVLNTSLNIMGEPIVETIEDAKNFLIQSNVDGLCIGNYYIKRRE